MCLNHEPSKHVSPDQNLSHPGLGFLLSQRSSRVVLRSCLKIYFRGSFTDGIWITEQGGFLQQQLVYTLSFDDSWDAVQGWMAIFKAPRLLILSNAFW